MEFPEFEFVEKLLKEIRTAVNIQLGEFGPPSLYAKVTAEEKERKYDQAVKNLICILGIAATGGLDDAIRSITLTVGSVGEYEIRSENFEEDIPDSLKECLAARDVREAKKETA